MITFTWKYTKDEKYIIWKAVWDGERDNDPLVDPEVRAEQSDDFMYPHPFCRTIDYEQEQYFSEAQHEVTRAFCRTIDYEQQKYIRGDPEGLRETGDYVANNEVTRALCKALSDDSQISKMSGNHDPYWYRMNLLECLSRLWD